MSLQQVPFITQSKASPHRFNRHTYLLLTSNSKNSDSARILLPNLILQDNPMDEHIAPSSEDSGLSGLPVYPDCLRRQLMLMSLRDWCMNRLSTLSLDERMDCARALTAEHLELLEAVNHSKTLWMMVEATN